MEVVTLDFFAPLTAIHLYVNVEDQKNKLIQISAFSCVRKFKLGELWPESLHPWTRHYDKA